MTEKTKQASSGSDWKRVLWICAAVFSGLFIPGYFLEFVQSGTEHFQKADVPILVICAVVGIFAAYHFRRPILRFLYYSVAVLFYISAAITALSLLSRLWDGVASFLTAPIGIKPDAQGGDFGGAFYLLLGVTAVFGIAYLVAKFFRGVGTEIRDLATTSIPPSPKAQ
jgi:hypothetical protein